MVDDELLTPAFFSNGFPAYIELLMRNNKLIGGSLSLLARTTTLMEDGYCAHVSNTSVLWMCRVSTVADKQTH